MAGKQGVAVVVAVALLSPLLLFAPSVRPSPYPHARQQRASLTLSSGIAPGVDGGAAKQTKVPDPSRGISALFGGQAVEVCRDVGAAAAGRRAGEVDALVRHLRDELARVGPSGRVVHLSHSHGSVLFRLAASRLSPDELSQIEAVTFGAGAPLVRCPETPFARCVNYYSVNDPILGSVSSARGVLEGRAVEGEGTVAARAAKAPVGKSDCGTDEAGDARGEEQPPEFVFLSPRDGNPAEDHRLLGPTYAEALRWEGDRFHRLYHPAPYRAGRSVGRSILDTMGNFCLGVYRLDVAVLRMVLLPFIFIVNRVNELGLPIVALSAMLWRILSFPIVVLWEGIKAVAGVVETEENEESVRKERT